MISIYINRFLYIYFLFEIFLLRILLTVKFETVQGMKYLALTQSSRSEPARFRTLTAQSDAFRCSCARQMKNCASTFDP